MMARLINSKVALARKSDTLLIIGDGNSMPGDVKKIDIKCDTASIGRAIKNNPSQHWFNADGETAIAWAKQLKAQSNGSGLITHTLGPVDGFDCDWEIIQPDYRYQEITNERGRLHGSSALFATLAGLAMGYQKIVLAGCPLDTEGHWYFEQKKETLGPLWLGVDFMAWLDFAESEQAKGCAQ